MSDLRKAAEDLLEVVEAAIKAGDWKVDGACDQDSAIVRLRQALAQPEQEPVGYVTDSGKSAYILLGVDLEDDTPVYATPPHYWGNVTNAELVEELRRRGMMENLYPEQEPVAWGMQRKDGVIIDVICPEEHAKEPGDYTIPLYTAPPKRKWVGLTDEERFKISRDTRPYIADTMRAHEEELKRRNT